VTRRRYCKLILQPRFYKTSVHLPYSVVTVSSPCVVVSGPVGLHGAGLDATV
jgi:hypothetical protein